MNLRFGHVLALLVLLASGCRPDTQAVHPERRSGKGEGCQLTNDCTKPYLCLGGRCLDQASGLSPAAKVCAIGECVDDIDCCPPRSKPEREDCDERKQECEAAGDCSQYENACPTCTRKCSHFVCSGQPPVVPECTTADDCAGVSNHCLAGLCVDCTADKHCGDGYICDAHACQLGCRHEAQCGALEACSNGRCVSRDCRTDRECAALLYSREAVCKAGTCAIPCESDRECLSRGTISTDYAQGGLGSGSLSTCVQGRCQSLGCERDVECAQSYSAGLQRGLRLCLSPAEADALRDAQH